MADDRGKEKLDLQLERSVRKKAARGLSPASAPRWPLPTDLNRRLHQNGHATECLCAHSIAGGIRLANAKVEGRAGWSVGFAQAPGLVATECVVWGLPGPT